MAIEINDGRVRIDRFETADPAVLGLLAGVEQPNQRDRLVSDALSTGARGLISMGLGIRVEDLEARIKAGAEAAATESMARLQAVVVRAAKSLEAGIDPGRSDSHSTRFLGELQSMLAVDGPLLSGFRAALDPRGDSPLARAYEGIRQDLGMLRDEIVRSQGRSEQLTRGTAKGVEFEVRLDDVLRRIARGLGAVVEYTARSAGNLSSAAVVGDYLLILPDGRRIVIEVKNQQSIGLTGKNGILGELDRAMMNRSAGAGLCISAVPAYPAEVGGFNVYGNRVLVVDDGEGTMITAGLRWLMSAGSAANGDDEVDLAAVKEGVERLRGTCQRFVTNRAALTEVTKSINKVSDSLGEMREEVLGLTDDLVRVRRGPDTNRQLRVG